MTSAEYSLLSEWEQRQVWRGLNPPRYEPKPICKKCYSCKNSFFNEYVVKLDCYLGKYMRANNCRDYVREPGADDE